MCFSRERWGRVSPVIYDDLPSKITQQPCVHLEYRVTSATQVRRVLKVGKPADLLRLNLAHFWARRLKLAVPDLSALGRQLRGRGNAKTSDTITIGTLTFDRDHAAGRAFARYARQLIDCPVKVSAHALNVAARGWRRLHMDRVLRQVELSAFLPTPSVPKGMSAISPTPPLMQPSS
jgi:hypothetical protein